MKQHPVSSLSGHRSQDGRRSILVCIFAFLAISRSVASADTATSVADPAPGVQPLSIGSRRELFVDDWLIAEMRGAHLALQEPERREVVFTCDAPWEDFSALPVRVMKVGDVIRLLYRAIILDPKHEEETSIAAIAESKDGLAFTRPRLGLHEFRGSRDNNLVNAPMPCAFEDKNPACLPAHRYKGFDGGWLKLYALGSPDGLIWHKLHEGVLDYPGEFDSVNTAFWDPAIGRYRSYTRYYQDSKVRAIQTATSEDFVHWTKPEPLRYADGDDRIQLYTNAIQQCPGAEHLYIGFPNRFMEQRKADPGYTAPGVNDALFMCSRDGVRWTRYLDTWVKPGLDPLNWTQRNNYPVWGLVETSPTEWSMYISEHFEHRGVPTRVRRLAVRPYGFVAVHVDYAGGEMTTKSFTFTGKALEMNYSTSAAGSVRVEIQDAADQPISGYALEDCPEIYGDQINRVVAWKHGSDLHGLAGQPIRLRFVMKDADLYAIRFQ